MSRALIQSGAFGRRRLGLVPTQSATADPAEILAQIRQLHAPTAVCRGCCSPLCAGDCHWADEYDGELLTVCACCCIDPDENAQTDTCIHDHNHGAEHAPSPICATAAILEQCARPD